MTCNTCRYSVVTVLAEDDYKVPRLLCADDEDNLYYPTNVCDKYERCAGCDEVEE